MTTIQLHTSDVQPDLYARLYDPATLERSPMLAWVVHAWTRYVAENGSEASRTSGAELNRLWDQLSSDEKLVATFLNGKLDRC